MISFNNKKLYLIFRKKIQINEREKEQNEKKNHIVYNRKKIQINEREKEQNEKKNHIVYNCDRAHAQPADDRLL